jgi:Uncharacterised nucleotidyltransferase
MIPDERPENELLLRLARPALNVAQAEQVARLLRGHLDWDYLIALADRHGVLPLFDHNLNSLSTGLVPLPVLSRLRDYKQENTRHSLFLTAELLRLIELLETHGIRAVPFKGPTLALYAYGDVALREFSDLDILVHRRDVLKVRKLLVGEGFKPTPELTNTQETALLRFDCAYNFSNDKNVVFDVHWNFAPPHSFTLDTNGLWDRLKTVTIARKQLLTLCVEDLLLILCLHGFTHFWERLGWICDVAGLIERQRDIDWESVVKSTTKQGSRRILSLGLLLAGDLLEAPIPPEVLQIAQKDAVVRSLAADLKRRLFADEPAASGIIDGALLQLRMRERKRDRIGFGLRLAATPRVYDWMLVPLPSWLFFLYYFLRPLRLAGKYGLKLLNGSQPAQNEVIDRPEL